MESLDISKFKSEERVCDFCGSKDFTTRQLVNFVGHKFQFVQCLNCDLVYQNPILSKKSRKHLYETKEYWDFRTSNFKEILNYYSYVGEFENRRKTNQCRMEWPVSRLSPKSRILDLGCGDGLYVSMLKEQGFKAYGMDISSSMINVAKDKYDVEILQKDVEKNWGFEEPFDAVVCYTISNFINPSLVFKQIQMNLRKGGYFFFNFADCDNLISRLFGGRFHLYRPTASIVYSKKTFMSYCKKFRLEVKVLKYDTQWIPLARFFSMIGLPSIIRVIKYFGGEWWDIKIKLPTSHIGFAVRNE